MLKDTLTELDEKYQGKDDILGKNCLTLANRVSSSRAIMIGNNLDQALCLVNPEFPKMATMYENLVGDYSSAYLRSECDYVIVDKIEKFKSKEGYLYTFIVYDKEKREYGIIQKIVAEKLTEDHGYLYNTNKIDSLDVGDEIETGDILYRSTSYDECMNYKYGVNLKSMYIIDDSTIEDAIVISKSAAKKLTSVKIETVRISLNDNDILINLYGDNNTYKAFPDIGEKIKKKLLAVKKRIIYSQSLFDLKLENMRKKSRSDVPYYISSDGDAEIIDINIYCNKDIDELNDSNYNKQILKYYKNELRYHKEIVNKLGKLIKSGKKVSDDLDYLYKRSLDILDDSAKWKDGNGNIFNNMIIEFTIKKDCGINVGSKLTGRYGDKGVVSEVRPDDEMPMLETGERVEMLWNALGVVNRLISGPLFEVELNFITNRIVEKMQQTPDYDDKEKLFFGVLSKIYEPQYKAYKKMYARLSEQERKHFLDSIEENGITIHEPPMYGNTSLDQIEEIYKMFNIQLYTCYVNKFGRKIKMMNKMVVGEKYVLKLKHTPESKFSARSTGYLNSKDLPFKSAKNNRSIIQKTAIRFGEMEFTNLLCNMNPDLLRELSMIYSTSVQARRDSGQLFTNNVLEGEDIDIRDDARNRAGEILKVQLRTIGIGLEITDDDEDCDDLILLEDDEINEQYDEE